MQKKDKKVFVAISGGVDSSVAAAMLLEQGYNCAGMYMITCEEGIHLQKDAEQVAEKLKIELHVLDLRSDFDSILEYFRDEYKRGRTPNPCVVCNRQIKFGKLWEYANSHGADLIATGHYAHLEHQAGEVKLFETEAGKDQSYVLSMMRREVLEKVILPVGGYKKSMIREIAAQKGLITADKKDSQEICFIPDDDYIAVLEQMCPELIKTGDIVDSEGKILGSHNGIHRFTIGQRRGLGVAMGIPYYVVGIDAWTNTVVLGPKKEVMHRKLRISNINWLIDAPAEPFEAGKVKIRYNNRGQKARVVPSGPDKAEIEFEEPVSAITPGQLAVIYLKDEKGFRVAGGGWIDEVYD